MGEEHVRMLHDFVNQTSGGQSENQLSSIIKKMESMVGYLQHLEKAITMMSTEITITRSQMNMMTRLLIDKGTFTKEEIDKRYDEEVAKPIKEHFEKLQKQMNEQQGVEGNA